ncbi:hypothetical protein [Flavobacterium hungaricum]|uniref:Uncharacterized protein n=1 Tax=Flavobacterium hungaricum TaxID=2082725 RepID=A0ABR9TKP4_9FLAO|nr:hypothetical protein [Flavobacterium hungaricum]MBE8725915.1 hypothetical protein [Flavobacterium hungaricum]
MKKSILYLIILFLNHSLSNACDKCSSYNNNDFKIKSASITHNTDLGITIWTIKVEGSAGKTTPKAVGQLNGAPVLGYVFPTTLKAADIGFGQAEGIAALALTSHPDFEDTPLWDENLDGDYLNDGLIWHAHWVLLVEDKRVGGGLSVREFKKGDPNVVLPPTNPGMAMYMDSPGFNIVTKENSIKVIVPDFRINNKTNFKFDAVSCYMEVSTGAGGSHDSEGSKPMLGVYKVYAVASGNLSLPYSVK